MLTLVILAPLTPVSPLHKEARVQKYRTTQPTTHNPQPTTHNTRHTTRNHDMESPSPIPVSPPEPTSLAAQHSTAQDSQAPGSQAPGSPAQHSTAWDSQAPGSPAQHSTAWDSPAPGSPAPGSPAQDSTAQRSPAVPPSWDNEIGSEEEEEPYSEFPRMPRSDTHPYMPQESDEDEEDQQSEPLLNRVMVPPSTQPTTTEVDEVLPLPFLPDAGVPQVPVEKSPVPCAGVPQVPVEKSPVPDAGVPQVAMEKSLFEEGFDMGGEEDDEYDNGEDEGSKDGPKAKKAKVGGASRKMYVDKSEIGYEGKVLRAKNLDELKTILAREGVAVCQNIISREECEEIYGVGVEDLKKYSGGVLDMNDPDTYGGWRDVKGMGNMILPDCGHAEFLMKTRVNKKIHKIYKGLCEGDGDLTCSTEGACMSLPFELNKGYGVYRGNCYTYTDQSLLCSDPANCFLSWVNLKDTNNGDASMMFYERSHLLHGKFKDMKESLGHDMKKLKKTRYTVDRYCKEEVQFFEENGCRKLAIECKAGDLVVYDARLFKRFVEPCKKREKPNIHLSAHMCMRPRKMMTKTMIKRKREYFYEGRTSMHDSAKPQYLPKKPRGCKETSGRVVPSPFPVSKFENRRSKRLFCVEDESEEDE